MSMYERGKPYAHSLKGGESVYICRCGLTGNAPFCDGSHKQTEGIAPLAYNATSDETVYICGCGRTGNSPWCDGSHKQ